MGLDSEEHIGGCWFSATVLCCAGGGARKVRGQQLALLNLPVVGVCGRDEGGGRVTDKTSDS